MIIQFLSEDFHVFPEVYFMVNFDRTVVHLKGRDTRLTIDVVVVVKSGSVEEFVSQCFLYDFCSWLSNWFLVVILFLEEDALTY